MLQLFIFDLITAFLQIFLIILTYETGHYGNEADLDDGHDLDGSGEEQQLLSSDENSLSNEEDDAEQGEQVRRCFDIYAKATMRFTAAGYTSAIHVERPILDFRIRQTLHRIVHDKPLSIVANTETEIPPSNAGDTEGSQTRLRRLQQARTRSRRRRMGQSDQDVEQGTEQRLDAGSDEEREVGLGGDGPPSRHM